MEHKRHYEQAFTLIELLIVISIIGILTSLLMVNFLNIRMRGRDAQRKSNIRQIQSALELYRSDNGGYPTNLSSNSNQCGTGSAMTYSGNTYMSPIPCDPTGTLNAYFFTSSGSTYTMAACLENANDSDPNDTTTAPSGDNATCSSGLYFVVNNP